MYGKSVTTGKKNRKHQALTVIENFWEIGVFPAARCPRTRTVREKRTRTTKPSLVDAREVIAEAEILELAKEDAQYRGVDADQGGDVLASVETLAGERRERDDFPTELPDAIRVLCEERLEELRRAASTVFEEWKEHYLHGQVVVGNAEYSGGRIFGLFEKGRADDNGVHGYRWGRVVSSIFPAKEPEKTLAHLLALIDARHDGMCPSSSRDEWGQFWNKQYREVGGKDGEQAFLLPPRVAVSAIMLLYLCESGTNSEVACSMTTGAVRPSGTPRCGWSALSTICLRRSFSPSRLSISAPGSAIGIPFFGFDAKQEVAARSVRERRNGSEEPDLVAFVRVRQIALVFESLAFRDAVLDQSPERALVDVLDFDRQQSTRFLRTVTIHTRVLRAGRMPNYRRSASRRTSPYSVTTFSSSRRIAIASTDTLNWSARETK